MNERTMTARERISCGCGWKGIHGQQNEGLRCPRCGHEVAFEPIVDLCPGCKEPAHASDSDDDGYHAGCRPVEERHDILCGCGWGELAMPQSRIDELTECPVCGRGFDSAQGWL